MSENQFRPKYYFNTIGSHEPVLQVIDGESISTTTLDAHGMDETGSKVFKKANPMTGPFYVNGAQPGDTLAVQWDYIYPSRNWGWTINTVASNIVEPEFIKQLPVREILRWDLDLEDGSAIIAESNGLFPFLKIPMTPFMGCFGVAPPLGQSISTETSDRNGGNMDYKGFTVGTTAYFPVFVEGALLYVGDGHAFQGDGEIAGAGVEVSMDIKFTVNLIKEKKIGWPRGESKTHIFTVGNARPLEQAIQHATTEMISWLKEDYGLSMLEANALLGNCVEYDVGNIYNKAYTMVCKVSKKVLSQISDE